MSTLEQKTGDRWSTSWLRGSAGRVARMLLVSMALGSLVALWPVAADPADSPRVITLVTRNMAFYLDGGDTPNPVLTMRAGEIVRIILRNEDAGIAHNFEVAAWDQTIPPLRRGQTASTVINVPDSHGRHVYLCGPHAALMRGIIEVVAGSTDGAGRP